MKNKNNFAKKITFKITVHVFLAVCIIFNATGCSYIGEFNRTKAANAIQADMRYQDAASLILDISRLPDSMGVAYQTSEDDTVDNAAIRAKKAFINKHPQLVVADQLGYIDLEFVKGKLGPPEMGAPNYSQRLGVWSFYSKAVMTEKGKDLWKEYDYKVNENILPLAIRQEPEVTGIVDEDPTSKKVDFTYTYKTTALGEAFDPESATFAKLPPDLQQALKETKYSTFGRVGNSLFNFKGIRKGTARFTKFDDGWRLKEIFFL